MGIVKQNAVIFDLDGVLFDINWRCKLDVDFETFMELSIRDEVIEPTARIIEAYQKLNYKVFYITSRPERYRVITAEKLRRINLHYPTLYMRADDDKRISWEVKKEIYETRIKDKFNVIAAFDDNKTIINMWESFGIFTYLTKSEDCSTIKKLGLGEQEGI